MLKDPWLPVGFRLADGSSVQTVQFWAADWQIVSLSDGGHGLLTCEELVRKWFDSNLVEEGIFTSFEFGSKKLCFASSGANHSLRPVAESPEVESKSSAMSFALALKATRQAGGEDGLQDAIYFEKITRLLPTYNISSQKSDDLVLGYWMSG